MPCLINTKIKFKYFPEISLRQATFNDVLFRGNRLAKKRILFQVGPNLHHYHL